MEQNRIKLAQQFIARRAETHNAGRRLVGSSEMHPDIAKDVGFRQTLLDTSMTTYKAMLFALGAPISSIRLNSENIRESKKTRNGVLEFAKNVYNAWDEMTERSCVELAPSEEHTIPKATPNP